MSVELTNLFQNGELVKAIWETIYMTFGSTALAYILGLPLGILIYITDKKGICPCAPVNAVLGFFVNLVRSIPFMILIVAIFPVAKLIVGTTVGNGPMMVILVIGATPYVARMVESSVREVNSGIIESAQSMGANTWQIIFKVIIPEAKPALITGSVISLVTILGYTAMAATIGGGGLGAIAYNEGYLRFKDDVVWMCVLFIVIIVQLIQTAGNFIAKKTDKRIKD